MLPRLLLVILTIVLAGCFAKIITIGVTFNEEQPLVGWRNSVVNFIITIGSSIVCFVGGFSSELREIDFDYSYYLGTDYK